MYQVQWTGLLAVLQIETFFLSLWLLYEVETVSFFLSSSLSLLLLLLRSLYTLHSIYGLPTCIASYRGPLAVCMLACSDGWAGRQPVYQNLLQGEKTLLLLLLLLLLPLDMVWCWLPGCTLSLSLSFSRPNDNLKSHFSRSPKMFQNVPCVLPAGFMCKPARILGVCSPAWTPVHRLFLSLASLFFISKHQQPSPYIHTCMVLFFVRIGLFTLSFLLWVAIIIKRERESAHVRAPPLYMVDSWFNSTSKTTTNSQNSNRTRALRAIKIKREETKRARSCLTREKDTEKRNNSFF